jgi:predicted aspartyl protease
MTTITYGAIEAYRGNRPYADLILHGPRGRFPLVRALVDTGADYAQLDAWAAQQVGITLPAVGQTVATAGGTTTLAKAYADLEVFGTTIRVPVLFGPGANPLLGRHALFQLVQEAGFGTQRWLR